MHFTQKPDIFQDLKSAVDYITTNKLRVRLWLFDLNGDIRCDLYPCVGRIFGISPDGEILFKKSAPSTVKLKFQANQIAALHNTTDGVLYWRHYRFNVPRCSVQKELGKETYSLFINNRRVHVGLTQHQAQQYAQVITGQRIRMKSEI